MPKPKFYLDFIDKLNRAKNARFFFAINFGKLLVFFCDICYDINDILK